VNSNFFQEKNGAATGVSQGGSDPQPVVITPTFDTSVDTALNISPGASKSLEEATLAVSQFVVRRFDIPC
jgi:hypothetical protein